jgi:hypothetical protein
VLAYNGGPGGLSWPAGTPVVEESWC